MKKIHWSQWMGIVPFIFLILLLIFGYIITEKVVILNLIFITILLSIYAITYLLGEQVFEFGESNLRDDEELLKLEKDDAAILWGLTNGAGIAFLIPGMNIMPTDPWMSVIGLSFLSIGNLVYEMFYHPRAAYLIRKRVIALDLKNNKIDKKEKDKK
ncbi:hypothetical protein HNV12_02930 [Methanococcoides sp. SA1]|nr:hypothetical protein [Methanococcoides sp. SA1]